MFTKNYFRSTLQLLTILLAISLLASACSPTASATLPDPTATPAPTATLEPAATVAIVATVAPPATDVPATDRSPQISLDFEFQSETVAAVSATEDAPYWELLPEYTRVTLQGYPVSDHLILPQIFIYPVEELRMVNESAGTIVTSLETLIQSPQEIAEMPFLPLFNAAQVMHTQVQYLDFQNGQGVRYLAQFAQGITPINNYELIYTYQGLTNDGKYYVAAVLPVQHPSLPVNATVTGNEAPEFTSDFPTYLANVVNTLNVQAASTFTPDLTRLDAIISSLEIR